MSAHTKEEGGLNCPRPFGAITWQAAQVTHSSPALISCYSSEKTMCITSFFPAALENDES